MSPRRGGGQRGFGLLELLVGVSLGTVVLMGLFSVYVATVRALDESGSQAALQRVGNLAIQAITRQAQWAQSIVLNPNPSCAPAGTTGRVLQLTVDDIAVSMGLGPSLPTAQLGTYCYYAGNGANGATAGALCQGFTPKGGVAGGCWNLLAAAQPGLFRPLGGARGVFLILQTNPANLFCPSNSDNTAIASGAYCLALAQSTVPGSTQFSGDVAFAITDNPTDGSRGMTFTESLMLRNRN